MQDIDREMLALSVGTSLSTSVRVNSRPAAVLSASATELLVQFPYDLSPGIGRLNVSVGSEWYEVVLPIHDVAPAIYAGRDLEGSFRDSYGHPVSSGNPAEAGTTISLEATGLGLTVPYVPAGIQSPFDPLATVTHAVSISILSEPPVAASVRRAVLAPGRIGVYRVDLDVPANLPSGTYPVQLAVAGVVSNIVYLPVRGASAVVCTYAISSQSVSVPYGGGTGEFSVSTTSTCSWTAKSDSDWITAVSPSSGTGSGRIAYRVAANSGTEVRKGTITVSGQTFAVRQDAAPPAVSGPTAISFWNGAGGQPNFISPCSVATMTGSGLAPGIQGIYSPVLVGPLPLQIAGVTVQFGEVFAPIFSLASSNGKESISVEVPCQIRPGTHQVTVKVGANSGQFAVQVLALAPGIFETPMPDGSRVAVVARPDGSYVSIENPARKGEVVRVYVTGIGLADPAVSTNSPGSQDQDSTFDVSDGKIVVGVNNAGVRVISARYAPNMVGIYQIAFEVPQDAPSGIVPLAIGVASGGYQVYGNASAIPVE